MAEAIQCLVSLHNVLSSRLLRLLLMRRMIWNHSLSSMFVALMKIYQMAVETCSAVILFVGPPNCTRLLTRGSKTLMRGTQLCRIFTITKPDQSHTVDSPCMIFGPQGMQMCSICLESALPRPGPHLVRRHHLRLSAETPIVNTNHTTSHYHLPRRQTIQQPHKSGLPPLRTCR